MAGARVPFPLSLPGTSGSTQFFSVLNQMDLLPERAEDGTGNRMMKLIARAVITAIVFPVFCLIGALYNGLVGFSKLGVGMIKQLFPENSWFAAARFEMCYQEAFKHLAYFGLDLAGYIFFLFVTGAYAFSPRQVTSYYFEVEKEISEGHAYQKMCGWVDGLSWERVDGDVGSHS